MDVRKIIHELSLFGLKQAYACIFGGFLLVVMIVTSYWYPFESIHRYDFIFLTSIAFQVFLLLAKLETPREAVVIIVFHVVATIMELFKTVALFIWIAENIATYTSIWIYPNQTSEWHMVPIAKLSSWYLLMLLSFVLVSLINNVQIRPANE